jgi:hypothetical protein
MLCCLDVLFGSGVDTIRKRILNTISVDGDFAVFSCWLSVVCFDPAIQFPLLIFPASIPAILASEIDAD